MIWQVELVLYLFLIFAAVVSIQAKDLLTAAVTLTIFTFVMALLFTTMGAVDVGFTEAVVGAGITGIFLLLALYNTTIKTSD